VGTLLLLLLMLLLLLLYEAKDSLPTKNFLKLMSNDVETTAGERGLIPGKVQTKTRWRKLQRQRIESREDVKCRHWF